jgi:hypothetical protein
LKDNEDILKPFCEGTGDRTSSVSMPSDFCEGFEPSQLNELTETDANLLKMGERERTALLAKSRGCLKKME